MARLVMRVKDMARTLTCGMFWDGSHTTITAQWLLPRAGRLFHMQLPWHHCKPQNTTVGFMSHEKCHCNPECSPLSTSSTFFPHTELSLHGQAGSDCKLCCVGCLAAGQRFMVMFWVIGQGQEAVGHWRWLCGDCGGFSGCVSWPEVCL